MAWIEARGDKWQVRWRMRGGGLQVTTWEGSRERVERIKDYVTSERGRVTDLEVYKRFDPTRATRSSVDIGALEQTIAEQRRLVSTMVEQRKAAPEGSWEAIQVVATLLMERHRHAGMVAAHGAVTGTAWTGQGSWESDD